MKVDWWSIVRSRQCSVVSVCVEGLVVYRLVGKEQPPVDEVAMSGLPDAADVGRLQLPAVISDDDRDLENIADKDQDNEDEMTSNDDDPVGQPLHNLPDDLLSSC